jgi:drug/metabolite transporter (DMT)-like permease
MIAPFLSMIAATAGIVVDKVGLSKRGIALRHYVPFLFLYLFFFTALATPFLGVVNWQVLLTPTFLFLFLIMVVLALSWNIFYYESLQKEKLYEFETIIIFVPLVTIALSWIFFPETWDPRIGIAALIGAAALVWSHWEKHHFSISHYGKNLIVAVVLMATEDIVVTELLRDQIFSPVSLYAIRTFILFGFFFFYYRPNVGRINRSTLNLISLSGLLGALSMIFKYYGYQSVGIPFTALILAAGPMGVYLASATVLHERMRARAVIAAGIIAIAIVYASSILKFS